MWVFTEHAEFVAAERNISREWVEYVVSNPKLRLDDARDPELEWFCAPIREFGDRVLRVIVNTRVAPWRVVSVFFDRSMKGKL